MALAAWLPKVRYHSEHFNERTWICYHQAPPWVRVVAHVGDAEQAKPHLEHNPLSLLGTCHAMSLRKLNDPGCRVCLLDRGLGCTTPWGDTREKSLLPSRPHTSTCVPQVVQAP